VWEKDRTADLLIAFSIFLKTSWLFRRAYEITYEFASVLFFSSPK